MYVKLWWSSAEAASSGWLPCLSFLHHTAGVQSQTTLLQDPDLVFEFDYFVYAFSEDTPLSV
jgi:hypothetical protein